MLSAREPRPDAGRFWRTLQGCLEAARGSWDLRAKNQGPDVKPCLVARANCWVAGGCEGPRELRPSSGRGSQDPKGLLLPFLGKGLAFQRGGGAPTLMLGRDRKCD